MVITTTARVLAIDAHAHRADPQHGAEPAVLGKVVDAIRLDQQVGPEATGVEVAVGQLEQPSQVGDRAGGDQRQWQRVEDPAVLLDQPQVVTELGGQAWVGDVELTAVRRAHDRRRAIGVARLGEPGVVMPHAGLLADRQPREAAARNPGADERPTSIAGQALPGDIGTRQRLARHRFDRVAPDLAQPSDRDLARGPVAHRSAPSRAGPGRPSRSVARSFLRARAASRTRRRSPATRTRAAPSAAAVRHGSRHRPPGRNRAAPRSAPRPAARPRPRAPRRRRRVRAASRRRRRGARGRTRGRPSRPRAAPRDRRGRSPPSESASVSSSDPERADPVTEIVEAADMRVQRRRADPELGGQLRQRELVQAIAVRDPRGGGDHRGGVQTRSRHQRPARRIAASSAAPGSATARPWPTASSVGSSARSARADSRSRALS